jgi:hypothetical protein
MLLVAAVVVPLLLGTTVTLQPSLPTAYTDYGVPVFMSEVTIFAEDGSKYSDTRFRPLGFLFYIFTASTIAFVAGKTWPKKST